MQKAQAAPMPFMEDPPREAGHPPSLGEDEADILLINIDGYEGPLHVLLELAKRQKVDLSRLSILQLVRQYLGFIDRAKELRLELAADYLVMAAWLAYLKSRLLLPKPDPLDDELSAEDMAAALQFQLKRLETLQANAALLAKRPLLGQQVFGRGSNDNDGLATSLRIIYGATLYDLLAAYGEIRSRQEERVYELPVFSLMSMDDAMTRLTEMLGRLPKAGKEAVWTTLLSFMPDSGNALYRRSAMASLFTAGLELAKQGAVEIRQETNFAPIFLRVLKDLSQVRKAEDTEMEQVHG